MTDTFIGLMMELCGIGLMTHPMQNGVQNGDRAAWFTWLRWFGLMFALVGIHQLLVCQIHESRDAVIAAKCGQ